MALGMLGVWKDTAKYTSPVASNVPFTRLKVYFIVIRYNNRCGKHDWYF